ncbi:MAG: hypothetical protein FWH23_05885 [Bacteroidales bacterium]|nr:hypothetical protein [Bacteroidales bacterium]MCL2133010.1 hypothetical protein [Bacteroidales bacterium]
MTKTKKTLCWAAAIIITLSAVLFQRMSGPTHSLKTQFTLNGVAYNAALPRSLNTDKDMKLRIKDLPPAVQMHCVFEPYISDLPLWDTLSARRDEHGAFIISFPPHHAAEKINYFIILASPSESTFLTNNPVTLRFKNSVPAWLLIPHILLMFAAMLFSNLSGILAFIKQHSFYRYAKWTLWCLLGGGLLLGCLVQKMAFGVFWSGWPFGQDLTDNKTLLIALVWAAALWINRKLKKRYIWAVIAAIVMLAMYAIPHSTMGSVYNPKTGQVTSNL